AGVPAASGTATCTVTVSDAESRKADKVMTINVLPPPLPPLNLTTAQLAAGQQGAAYSQQLAAAGGKPPYAWSVAAGALPTGLALNAASGLMSGMPTAAGGVVVTLTVRDQDGRSINGGLTIKVTDPATVPAISSVKYKAGKKLMVWGDRFNE